MNAVKCSPTNELRFVPPELIFRSRCISPMKQLLFLSILAILFLEPSSSAQQFAPNEGIKVSFPTPSWTETEAPPELLASFGGTKSPAKLLFHAVSQSSRLRLHISSFDYPTGPREIVLTGFLDGVRRRFARQTTETINEYTDQDGLIPMHIFEANLPSDFFLEVRAVLCAGRVFLIEIGGPTASRTEAKQCLEGVSITGESALPVEVLTNVVQLRSETRELRGHFESGRRRGRALGIAIIALIFVVIATGLAFALRKKKSRQPSGRVPPPINSSEPPSIPPVISNRNQP